MIDYRILTSENDFTKCIDLQREVFHFSDIETISPLFLKLFARNNPPIGFAIGAFRTENEQSELIAILLATSTFISKSVYVIALGVKPQYQNKLHGYNLLLKLREISLEKDIQTMYGIFNPLEANLGRLYFKSLGFRGVSYEYDNNINASGKLLVKWDFKIPNKKTSNKEIASDFELLPIANLKSIPQSELVLIEIPKDYKNMSENLQNFWQQTQKFVFNEYLNTRNYNIIDCLTINLKNERKSYYKLQKQ